MMSVFSDKLAQICCEHETSIGSDRVQVLQSSCEEVVKVMSAAVSPLLDSINDSIEAILLTMHKEDFSASDGDSSNTPGQACSLYMKELQAFLERIARDFLSTLTCKEFLSLHLHRMAEKTIERFVMQVNRPIRTKQIVNSPPMTGQLGQTSWKWRSPQTSK